MAQSTGDVLAPNVFGVTLRFQNLGSKTVKAHPPSYYSVLRFSNTTGADFVKNAKGPCGGAFYNAPIHLPPHGSTQGCIPFQYGPNETVVEFGFSFGLKLHIWRVRST